MQLSDMISGIETKVSFMGTVILKNPVLTEKDLVTSTYITKLSYHFSENSVNCMLVNGFVSFWLDECSEREIKEIYDQIVDNYYSDIIYLQGEQANNVIKGINRIGEIETVKRYLSKWDNGEYNEIKPFCSAMPYDKRIQIDEYLLTYNTAYSYVGLERILTKKEYEEITA